MTRWKCLLLVIFLILVMVGQVPMGAAEPPRSTRKAKPKRSSEVTVEQEQEVMKFLRLHHAELADLVEHLQTSSPSDYRKAIRDLWKARDRLMHIKQRDRARYELELDVWLVQSKIQLLVARLALKDDGALREDLRSLLGQQVDLRHRLLVGERERVLERLAKIDEQVDRYSSGRSEVIEKQFLLLTASSRRLKQERMERSTKRKLRPSKPSSRADEP
jgi:hypothetical protein